MRCIRLLFAAMPRMLADILKDELEGQADLAIVAELATLDGLPEAAARTRPDLIVVAANRATLPPECRRLMYSRPHTQTISIAQDGTEASVYRLLPHRVAVKEASPPGVVGAMRRAARHRLDRPGPS